MNSLVTVAREAASTGGHASKAGLVYVASKARETLPQVGKSIARNPGTTAACVAGIAMVAAPAVVALPALGAVGFGASGPVAGSMAAAAQSGVGSVVAPSLFATAQSAAMGGYGTAAVFGAVQAVGGTVAATAGGAMAWARSKAGKSEETSANGAEEKSQGESGNATRSKL